MQPKPLVERLVERQRAATMQPKQTGCASALLLVFVVIVAASLMTAVFLSLVIDFMRLMGLAS